MPVPIETILILGGTAEANRLVSRIRTARPDTRIILSLAGRTETPVLPEGCDVRSGGFGGVAGLASFLQGEVVTHLVDATHPFAAGISRNAAKAAETAGIPRVALVRPAWESRAGDRWTRVACLGDACNALPAKARPLLALGRQHLAPFARRSDLDLLVRMIEPPDPPLPFPAEIVLGRPSPDADKEAELLQRLGVTHLVCRNSGGAASYAKVEAARRLGLAVIMIARPPAPPPPVADSIDEVLAVLGMAPSA